MASTIVVAVLLSAACSGGDDDGSAGATDTTRSPPEASTRELGSTTTTYASVEDEIVARYKAFWQARFAANSPPNPDDPALRDLATGEQLDQVVLEAQANRDAGVEFRRPEDPIGFQQVDVLSVSDDIAVLQECYVDDGLVVRSSDGTVVDDSVRTQNIRGEMHLVDGQWRLAKATLVQQWDGVAGCALAD